MSYSALPPEINSGLMYAGAGSGPLLSAATAWQTLSSELAQSVAAVQSTINGLSSTWAGPSSVAMQSALAPYTTWLSSTSAYASQMGAHAASAASLYEAAHAATVPPPVIAANRAQLASLVATNILGQNTPAIMATEAQYMAMWAQDGAAMDAYASASQGNNGQLKPHQSAPQVANPAAAQSSAPSTAANTVEQTVSNTLGKSLTDPLGTTAEASKYLSLVSGPASIASGGAGITANLVKLLPSIGGAASSAASTMSNTALTDAIAGIGRAVSTPMGTLANAAASLGRAVPIGGLSVPSAWAAAAPGSLVSSVSSALPGAASAAASEMAGMAPANMLAPLGAAGRAVSQAASVNAKVIGIIPKLMPEFSVV